MLHRLRRFELDLQAVLPALLALAAGVLIGSVILLVGHELGEQQPSEAIEAPE